MKTQFTPIKQIFRILSVFFILLLGISLHPFVQAGSSPDDMTQHPGLPQDVGPAATVLNESFSSGAQPAGWSVRINNGSRGWRFDNPGGRANNTGGSGGMAIADSDWGGFFTMNTELRTPALNLTGYTDVQLQFKTHYRGYGSSVGDVDVSTNGGSSWNNVWRRTSDYRGTVNLNLSSLTANKSNVIIRFHYYNAYWAWWWQVDNVVVGAHGPPSAPTNLSATAAGSSRINLSWRGNGATMFEIDRSLNGSSWTRIAAIVNGATTYSNTGLSSNTRYYYRVRAYNSYGKSAYSNTANALTSGGVTSVPVDITVSLYRNPSSTDRTKYENIIRYFADGVYEASNGANKLRKVTFYVNGANSDRSHVVWIKDCWPNAHISGYNNAQSGWRIQMCDVFNSNTNFLANECGYEGGGYTLAHEFGHYFYSLYDEYKGSSSSNTWIGMPLSGDDAVSNSIMNSQWNARTQCSLSSPSFNWLNFSTSINNPSSSSNAQRRCYGASGWDTLRRAVSQDPRDGQRASLTARIYHSELVAVAPASGQAPSLQLPAQRTQARSALQFVWSTGGVSGGSTEVGGQAEGDGVYRQLVIDASDGMLTSAQLDSVKLALSLLVDWLPPEDTLGIVTYHAAAQMVLPLTLNSPANRPLIQAAIQTIAATEGISETDIGQGLHLALTGLTAPTVPTDTTRVVYLIAHRQSSTGPYPLDLVPEFQDSGIPVFTFGYGGDDDLAEMLRELAAQTGGMHAFVGGGVGGGTGLTSLFSALQNANQATSPLVDVTLKMGMTKLLGGDPFETPIMVDDSLDRLHLAVAYRGEPVSVTLQLFNPGGDLFAIPLYHSMPGLGSLNMISITEPVTGPWLLRAQATDPANPGLDMIYWAGSATENFTGTLAASVESVGGGVVALPAPIVLRASVGLGVPVTGAYVTATVTLPDGSQMPVVFADDGLAPDAIANDGFYAAVIDPPMVGEYQVSVLFANYFGTAMFTELSVALAIDENGNLREPLAWPVGFDFERFANVQVQVAPSASMVYLPIVLNAAGTP